MNPYLFTYKSFAVTWFMALSITAIIISNITVKNSAKKIGLSKSKVEDMFFLILIAGFIGSRLFYVLFNYSSFKDDLFSILKLSHMNLYLFGGIITALGSMAIITKKNSLSYYQAFKIFVLPFYFSMAIGIWSAFFDGFLVGKEYSGILSVRYFGAYRHPVVIYISILFLLGVLVESMNFKESTSKKITYTTFIIVIFGYYVIRHFFAY